MKKTNLTVEMVYVTPEVAKNLLRYNTKNRNTAENNKKFLTKEMKNGRFIENGESIVFDKNGVLLDGQHRLLSIITSGNSYFIPIVRGVEPNAMATFDTGKNRTAADILTLNGFKQGVNLSTLIILIDTYGTKKLKKGSITHSRRVKLTNQQILEYCQDNYHWLIEIIHKNKLNYSKSKLKVLSLSQINIISYLLGGENPSSKVYDFIGHLTGNSIIRDSAASYLYSKLYDSKINKEPLNFYWILGMSIKAYNYFIDGNPAIRYFKFKVTEEMPKVKEMQY